MKKITLEVSNSSVIIEKFWHLNQVVKSETPKSYKIMVKNSVTSNKISPKSDLWTFSLKMLTAPSYFISTYISLIEIV